MAERNKNIRPFRPEELDRILDIWLNANFQAHSFVDPAYWTGNLNLVREQLPQAELWVYESGGTVCGFTGITGGDYIAGIFVDELYRGHGIGKKLLDHAKQLHPLLKLHVYRKNERAVRFYLRESFTCAEEHVDSATGESELLLTWGNKSKGGLCMVRFHEHADNSLLRFAVICTRYQNQWLLVRHRERRTWECPGGHRESGEDIDATARRELWEETGALHFRLHPVCAYSVVSPAAETYGMLYYAEIDELGVLPGFEIAEVRLFDRPPDQWTYPDIQPYLMERVQNIQLKENYNESL